MKISQVIKSSIPMQLLMVMSVVLPMLWGLIVFDLHRLHRQITENTESQLQNLVLAFAEEVKSSVNAVDYALHDMREQWLKGTPDFSAAVRQRQLYLKQDVVFQVAIINASGRLVFTSLDPNAKPIDLSDREHFRVHRDRLTDELFISKPLVGRVANRWTVQFTRALRKPDGTFDGVIVLSVPPDYFARFYERINLGTDRSIALVRTTGEFVARSPHPELALGRTLTDVPFLGVKGERHGTFIRRSSVDGTMRLFSWRTLQRADLAVAIGQSLDTIYAPYYRQRSTHLLVGAICSLLFGVIAYVLLGAQRQRARAAVELEQAREALGRSQRLEAIGKLTGGVAHDFNNVLQIISGNLQLLQLMLKDNAQAGKRLESALGAVDRGAKLSAQLLAFARKQALKPIVIDLGDRMRNMRDMLMQTLGEWIEIETIIDPRLWNTLVDPNQLENVILNLALNARDAMHGSGRLTIELRNVHVDEARPVAPDVPPGEYVMLTMADTGCGMAADVLERAFEPFFTTKAEGQGTGLGLSMAYGFVKQSHGQIKIASKVGVGTTISIYFPRAIAPVVQSSGAGSSASCGGSETVLVVEDDAEVQSTVVAMLSDLGYRVLKANNGEKALRLLKEHPEVDLLFTDVVMPGGLRGPELADKAKALVPGLLVLFTSGYPQNVLGNQGQLGADVHLLLKPYRREQLAKALRDLLATRSGNAGVA